MSKSKKNYTEEVVKAYEAFNSLQGSIMDIIDIDPLSIVGSRLNACMFAVMRKHVDDCADVFAAYPEDVRKKAIELWYKNCDYDIKEK